MRLVFIMLILFSGTFSHAQTTGIAVANIRNTVQKINQDTSYSKKVLNNEDFLEQMTDGGGQLTGYFKKGELVKIVEWIGLSSCITITEYYLQHKKLIFAYTQGKEFEYADSTGSFNSDKQALTMECRFYFEKEKMLRSILNGSTRCGGAPDKNWWKEYKATSSRYIALLLKK